MIEIAIAVVEWNGLFLIGERPEGVPLAGYWEFPGGKVEAGESPAVAAARECVEETGIEVNIGDEYPEVLHAYEHGTLRLHFFAATPVAFVQPTNDRFQWVRRSELGDYRFPDANTALVKQLIDTAEAVPRDARFWIGPAQLIMLLVFAGLLVNSGGRLVGGEGMIAVLLGLALLLVPVANHTLSRGRGYGFKSLWFDLTAIGISLFFSMLAGPFFLLIWIPLLLLRRL
jgi:8-oxo-dGTP diphosphatase